MTVYTRKLFTLAFIREGDKVLLGFKKRGFGQGRWNAFGGKVEPGETTEEGAIREVREEAGVEVVGGVEKVGELEFTFEGDTTLMHVIVYHARGYTGTPTESEEMKPQWFNVDNIPYTKMWPDDELWYPIYLRGGKFRGAFHFRGYDQILSQKLEEVQTLS
ncbi:7,8-dihydro-8-oxoguanine triphosphatase-like [Homarus americanus]|uniref:78-dihydro-8-oxoguanine triphosphatase-like n=1 Tax=Homarus americanus TaxID=6706 RepID=A0A8J5TM22_HOMAM|nr:7,8-dihydro-8-oxoguanine triphosphatase-like [Homarus americanus]KAG7175188.1 78-dihydro-8-oxoguanine triphosphatase-like [Homarus americanus]